MRRLRPPWSAVSSAWWVRANVGGTSYQMHYPAIRARSSSSLKQSNDNERLLTISKELLAKDQMPKVTSPGLKLVDYVRNGRLKIDMSVSSRDSHPRFNLFDEGIVPQVLRNGISREETHFERLEIITVVVLNILHYRQGTIDQTVLHECLSRASGRSGLDLEQLKIDAEARLDLENPAASYIGKEIELEGYPAAKINKWIECVSEKTIAKSMKVMVDEKWPQFLVLFTLRRNCNSRVSAYEALRLFESQFPKFSKAWQMALFIRTLRILQKSLPLYIPLLCRIFVGSAHADIRIGFTYNQILWLLAKFGVSWNRDDSLCLSESQRIIVEAMKQDEQQIDLKGYVALAYIVGVRDLERARKFAQFISEHSFPVSREEQLVLDGKNTTESGKIGSFPYMYGLSALKILLAKSSLEAISIFESSGNSRRVAEMWTILLLKFRANGDLNPSSCEIVWNKICDENVKISRHLIQLLSTGFKSMSKTIEMLNVAAGRGMKISASADISPLFKIISRGDLALYRSVVQNSSHCSLPMMNTLINAEAHMEPDLVWKTYTRMLIDMEMDPSVNTLMALCRASLVPHLKWDNLYAVQRTVVEFKRWIRGANIDGSDVNDPLKIYPSQELLHLYIIMLGRARYDAELLEILPWMERISLEPNKKCLCALITHSPNGDFLLKHGSKTGGKNWPTAEEVEHYRGSRS